MGKLWPADSRLVVVIDIGREENPLGKFEALDFCSLCSCIAPCLIFYLLSDGCTSISGHVALQVIFHIHMRF